MTLLCLMLVTRARVPWFQIWTYYVFMNICKFFILSCKSIVTYYVLWSGNPEVTIIGTTPDDDRSLRSSCIHCVLMLWSGTLLKGGFNPLVSARTPLPREGRTNDVMQVFFHKHVWLYSEYMPTLHWWTRASSVSPYVIPITWGIASDIIIHHWLNAYELFTSCASLIYFSVAIVTITTN